MEPEIAIQAAELHSRTSQNLHGVDKPHASDEFFKLEIDRCFFVGGMDNLSRALSLTRDEYRYLSVLPLHDISWLAHLSIDAYQLFSCYIDCIDCLLLALASMMSWRHWLTCPSTCMNLKCVICLHFQHSYAEHLNRTMRFQKVRWNPPVGSELES